MLRYKFPASAVEIFVTQVMSALHLKGGLMGGLIYNAALIAGAVAGVAILAVGALVCYRWAPETCHLGLGALDQAASEPEEPGSLALPVEGAP